MRRTLLLVVLLTAGCASHEPLVAVGVACDAYASALTVVAGLNQRGKLSPSQVGAVDGVVAMVSPICTNPSATANQLARVEEGLLKIRGVVQDANR